MSEKDLKFSKPPLLNNKLHIPTNIPNADEVALYQ